MNAGFEEFSLCLDHKMDPISSEARDTSPPVVETNLALFHKIPGFFPNSYCEI